MFAQVDRRLLLGGNLKAEGSLALKFNIYFSRLYSCGLHWIYPHDQMTEPKHNINILAKALKDSGRSVVRGFNGIFKGGRGREVV